MPKIVFLPHHEICPEGAVVEAEKGQSICEAALKNGLDIEHACEMSCACTTCHVHVREGLDSLTEADELEDDFLDKAWGLDPDSRLSCQAMVEDEDLVVEIPNTPLIWYLSDTKRKKNMIKWTDINEIAIELADNHTDIDPQYINFVDLRNLVLSIEDFSDDPDRCGEKILEAIQMAWIEELD